MAVVSAEAQRALELWLNRLRSELRGTKAQLHEARRVADELAAECESHRAARNQNQQHDLRAQRLEEQLAESVAECQRLREERAEIARLCKTHERDVRDLRAELRGEQAKAVLRREERSKAKKSAAEASQQEVTELRQVNRALGAELGLLRLQRDQDTARRTQERRTRQELRLAIKELAGVVDCVTAQVRNSDNRHAALPLGAPNPSALERVLNRLRTALRVRSNTSGNVESDPETFDPDTDSTHQPQAVACATEHHGAAAAEKILSPFGPSPAVTRAHGSEIVQSRRQRLSTDSSRSRPRTTARQHHGIEAGDRTR